MFTIMFCFVVYVDYMTNTQLFKDMEGDESRIFFS